MGFLQHLGVLRKHMLRGIIWFLLGGVGAVLTLDKVWEWMLGPLCSVHPESCRVYPRELLEPFYVYLKLGCLLAALYALPLLLYEAWAFIAPGLYRREKRVVLPVCLAAGVLFIAGASFGYWVVFPPVFHALFRAEGGPIRYLVSMDAYFGFIAKLFLCFGTIFETPLVMMLFSVLGLVKPRSWTRYRRIAYLVLAVLAAVIAPSDPFSLVAMWIPMCLLYELGILLARLVYRDPDSFSDDEDGTATAPA